MTSGGILQEIKAVCKGHSLDIMECLWDVDALERDIEVRSSKLLLLLFNLSHTDKSCNDFEEPLSFVEMTSRRFAP